MSGGLSLGRNVYEKHSSKVSAKEFIYLSLGLEIRVSLVNLYYSLTSATLSII